MASTTRAVADPIEQEDWAVGIHASVSNGRHTALGFHARRVVVSRLSLGASFDHMDTKQHYEHCGTDCPKAVDATRVFAEFHPLPTSYFDPWIRLGLGFDVRYGSNWPAYSSTSYPRETRASFAKDAAVGISLHVPHVSIGPHVRVGSLGLLAGIHAELRF